MPVPPRQPRKRVEKAIHYLTQRWWRTAKAASPAEAQASVDRFCATVRHPAPGRPDGGTLADEVSSFDVGVIQRLRRRI